MSTNALESTVSDITQAQAILTAIEHVAARIDALMANHPQVAELEAMTGNICDLASVGRDLLNAAFNSAHDIALPSPAARLAA